MCLTLVHFKISICGVERGVLSFKHLYDDDACSCQLKLPMYVYAKCLFVCLNA